MSAASIDDACDLVAAAYERLAREQDAAERLPAAFDAAIREAIADSRREAAREVAELCAALLAVDAPAAERAATQAGALSLPGSIPSATLRDEWAPAWRAYQAPEARCEDCGAPKGTGRLPVPTYEVDAQASPTCPSLPCVREERPYCHCQDCGETGVRLTEDGYCQPCEDKRWEAWWTCSPCSPASRSSRWPSASYAAGRRRASTAAISRTIRRRVPARTRRAGTTR